MNSKCQSTPMNIRKKFMDIGEFKFTMSFFEEVNNLAHDSAPITFVLQNLRVNLCLEEMENLLKVYKFSVYALLYNFFGLVAKTKSVSQSIWTIIIQPNENFHPSNAFHHVVSKLLVLVASTSSDISICSALVEKQSVNFCSDTIHFNACGAKRKYFMFREFINIVANRLHSDTKDLEGVMREVNDRIKLLHKSQHPTQVMARDAFSKRKPINTNLRDKFFEFQPSRKLLSVYCSKSVLTNHGKIPLAHLQKKHLYTLHTDSMFWDFSDYSVHKNKHTNKLLVFPASLTISPGASAYTLCKDIDSSPLIRNSKFDSFLSILYPGTNEKLSLHDTLTSFLCNKKIIRHSECSICKRRKKLGKTVQRPHKPLEFLMAYETICVPKGLHFLKGNYDRCLLRLSHN